MSDPVHHAPDDGRILMFDCVIDTPQTQRSYCVLLGLWIANWTLYQRNAQVFTFLLFALSHVASSAPRTVTALPPVYRDPRQPVVGF
jgi:hypothetical protein